MDWPQSSDGRLQFFFHQPELSLSRCISQLQAGGGGGHGVHLGCALTIGACLRRSHGPNDGIFLHPFVRDACTPCALELCLRLRRVSVARLCWW